MSTTVAPMSNHVHQLPPTNQQCNSQLPQQDYARMVAGQFVQQYYHVLKSYSKHLHRFYMEDSSFTISGKDGLAESKTAKGGGIHGLLTEFLPEAQADCQTFEAQPVYAPGYASQDPYYNGTPILIQAAGALITSGKIYSFNQTFFLAPFQGANRGPGYYVANDILRLSDSCPAAAENGFVAAPALQVTTAPQARTATRAASPPVKQELALAQAAAATPSPPAAQPNAPATVSDKPTPSQVSAAAAAAAAVAASPAPTLASPPRQPAPAPAASPQAPPSPSPAANLTWSERLKLSAKAAIPVKAAAAAMADTLAAIAPSKPAPRLAAPSPASTPTAPAPSSSTEPSTAVPANPTSFNGSAPAHDAPDTHTLTVMVQDLPGCSPQAVHDLVSQFGPVKGGVEAITIRPYKNEKHTAYFDFETRAALETAMAAELYLQGTKVRVVEKRGLRHDNSRGRGGRYGGRNSSSSSERRSDSFGRRGPAAVANGGGSGAHERPPRSSRGGYQNAEGRTDGTGGAERAPRSEGGRLEGGRGRRGRGSNGRFRGRGSDGRAASPATECAAGGDS